MSFVSAFFALFYLLALSLRATVRSDTRSYAGGLLALSWAFYAWQAPRYLALLLFATCVAHTAGRLLADERFSPPARRAILATSLALNLAPLVYFKYASFITGTIVSVGDWLGMAPATGVLARVLLPVGISFYTFMAMSYAIDVYRRDLEPEPDFARFACFLAFFPHLVAGPIIRGSDFLYQLRRRRRLRPKVFAAGTYLILRGLFFKVVVADNLGQLVDEHWRTAAGEASPLAFSMLMFFTAQLFCDFAGYTDIARGLAYQLGYRLPINFDAPYTALTFTDFWRRWHITLSGWMRDYLYVPFGGNRKCKRRATVNLVLVMLLSGLWHGVHWTFVVWGAIHGAAVAFERVLGLTAGPRSKLAAAIWFAVVQLTWIVSLGMFRAESVSQGWHIIGNALVGLAADAQPTHPAKREAIVIGWWLILPVVALHLRTLASQRCGFRGPSPLEQAVYSGCMLAALLTLYASSRQFIYFQF